MHIHRSARKGWHASAMVMVKDIVARHGCTKVARTRLSTRVSDGVSGRIGRVKGWQSTDLGQGTS